MKFICEWLALAARLEDKELIRELCNKMLNLHADKLNKDTQVFVNFAQALNALLKGPRENSDQSLSQNGFNALRLKELINSACNNPPDENWPHRPNEAVHSYCMLSRNLGKPAVGLQKLKSIETIKESNPNGANAPFYQDAESVCAKAQLLEAVHKYHEAKKAYAEAVELAEKKGTSRDERAILIDCKWKFAKFKHKRNLHDSEVILDYDQIFEKLTSLHLGIAYGYKENIFLYYLDVLLKRLFAGENDEFKQRIKSFYEHFINVFIDSTPTDLVLKIAAKLRTRAVSAAQQSPTYSKDCLDGCLEWISCHLQHYPSDQVAARAVWQLMRGTGELQDGCRDPRIQRALAIINTLLRSNPNNEGAKESKKWLTEL